MYLSVCAIVHLFIGTFNYGKDSLPFARSYALIQYTVYAYLICIGTITCDSPNFTVLEVMILYGIAPFFRSRFFYIFLFFSNMNMLYLPLFSLFFFITHLFPVLLWFDSSLPRISHLKAVIWFLTAIRRLCGAAGPAVTARPLAAPTTEIIWETRSIA